MISIKDKALRRPQN